VGLTVDGVVLTWKPTAGAAPSAKTPVRVCKDAALKDCEPAQVGAAQPPLGTPAQVCLVVALVALVS